MYFPPTVYLPFKLLEADRSGVGLQVRADYIQRRLPDEISPVTNNVADPDLSGAGGWCSRLNQGHFAILPCCMGQLTSWYCVTGL